MERHYGMDWLRIGAFGLLIFYHIGMFFVPWDWHVKTAQPANWVAVPMLATNAWRLALLFAVSGYASAALYAKRPGAVRFLGDRSARLLIPLIFAVIMVVPAQPWVELQFKHGYTQGFAHFWTQDYFRFGTLEGIVLPTWQHLWFVVYLWFYTAVLGLLLLLPNPVRDAVARAADAVLAGPGILVVPLALLWLNLVLTWPGHRETHAFFDDWPSHLIYGSMFLFGYHLRGSDPIWAAIRRWWRTAAALAVLGYAIVAGIEIVWPGKAVPPIEVRALFGAARVLQGWCAIVALVGFADRFWNRDHPWRATLTEAVFPFYIVHQTIIVVVGWYLLPLRLHPVAEFAILIGATVTGCWLFYRIGREIPVVRLLIGLRGVRTTRPKALAVA